MMRWTLAIFAVVLLGGCQASQPAATAERVYKDNPASALVFDPPVMDGARAAFLDRSERAAGAFVAYEDLSATYFYIQTDDRPGDPNSNWMYRRAVTERVGVSYR